MFNIIILATAIASNYIWKTHLPQIYVLDFNLVEPAIPRRLNSMSVKGAAVYTISTDI